MQKIEQQINNLGINKGNTSTYLQFQNGRVTNPQKQTFPEIPLFDKDKINSNFAGEALYGIQDKSPLSLAFFSKENLQNLQNMIRYNVWLRSGKKYVIDEQSPTELEVIMRSIYLQYSLNLPFKLQDQIKELNNILIQQTVPQIISYIYQYQGYIYDIEKLPTPIELPKNMSSKGTRLLRSITSTF